MRSTGRSRSIGAPRGEEDGRLIKGVKGYWRRLDDLVDVDGPPRHRLGAEAGEADGEANRGRPLHRQDNLRGGDGHQPEHGGKPRRVLLGRSDT